MALAVTTRVDPYTNAPTSCIRGGTGDGGVALPLVNLNPYVLVCVYGSCAGGSPTYGTAVLQNCGSLPVEPSQFTVE